jgi:hypothetical protein
MEWEETMQLELKINRALDALVEARTMPMTARRASLITYWTAVLDREYEADWLTECTLIGGMPQGRIVEPPRCS